MAKNLQVHTKTLQIHLDQKSTDFNLTEAQFCAQFHGDI